jgi:hypothetical protein
MRVSGWKIGMIYDEDENNPSHTENPGVQNVTVAGGMKTQMKKFHYYKYKAAEYGRTVLNFAQE